MIRPFHPKEGRVAIATKRGMDAMDALCRKACDTRADGEAVWS
jgi:hypothetical protein